MSTWETFWLLYWLVAVAFVAVKTVSLMKNARAEDFGFDLSEDSERRSAELASIAVTLFIGVLGRGAIWPLALLADAIQAHLRGRTGPILPRRPKPLDVEVEDCQEQAQWIFETLYEAEKTRPRGIHAVPGVTAHLYLAAFFFHGVRYLNGMSVEDGRLRIAQASVDYYDELENKVAEIDRQIDALQAFCRALQAQGGGEPRQ